MHASSAFYDTKLVLQEVFLGEPREMEISAVRELLHAVANTLA